MHQGDPPTLSLVVPAARADQSLADAVDAYVGRLGELPLAAEVLLVAGVSPASRQQCERLADGQDLVAVVDDAADAWGRSVRLGLEAAAGDVLCWVNWSRASAAAVGEVAALALRQPEVVLRATRRSRDSAPQKLGSLLYNLECRLLFDLLTWDVNGTPKAFPRSFGRLLELRSDDELLDTEFAIVCLREHYPVIEVPVTAPPPRGPAPSPFHRSARLYWEALRLWRAQRR